MVKITRTFPKELFRGEPRAVIVSRCPDGVSEALTTVGRFNRKTRTITFHAQVGDTVGFIQPNFLVDELPHVTGDYYLFLVLENGQLAPLGIKRVFLESE